ncbi:hypothetical protein Ddye_009753 [Dipteronia dyeriana]|uniref:BHLH domain-containing protein n=1 Tax=Dipteronia dyeriana TaxID=168575 RepID=A0AAD9XBX9_9ROSI|nr:hypothetical protein Ddye_009753 [Dipteronia dyeriana]
MDEYDIINQCNMDSLAEFSCEQDIANALGLSENFKHSFSSESYTSYTALNETPTQTRIEKPFKQAKTNSWNSSTTAEYLSPISSPTSQFLSFEQPTSSPKHFYRNLESSSYKSKDEAVSSQGNNIHFSHHLGSENSLDSQNYATQANINHGTKRTCSNTKTPSMTKDHILAERKRREKLSQRFIALSAIVPGLKKMDKASVLGDAIKYVKELQERVNVLEEQTRKRTVESVVFMKKSQLSTEDESSSCTDESFDSTCDAAVPEIEARASDKDVLIRIHFQKQKGFLPKILSDVEKLHLSILNSSVLPFGNSTFDLTIIAQQKNDEFQMTMKDFVKELRQGRRIYHSAVHPVQQRFSHSFAIFNVLVLPSGSFVACHVDEFTYQPKEISVPKYLALQIANLPSRREVVSSTPQKTRDEIFKDRMSEPDPVQPDNIGFDDTAYHEFLQRQAYLESLNYPANPNPHLIISEPNASQPSPSPGNMTSQLRNIPDFAADPNFEEALEKDKKHVKSDLFVLHMKKVTKPDGTCWAVYNYCPKEYKWIKSGGYGTYRKHITTRHLAELAKGSTQSQISKFSTPDTQLFKYDQANREELARMVAVEHLPFSFCEKVGFIKYCHKALNPTACRVPRTTLTHTMIYGPPLNISVPQNENLSQTRSFGVLGAGSALLSQKIKRLRSSSSSSSSLVSYHEIETYHNTNFEFIGDGDVDQFDILHWWREHQKHFPILSIIAKQILATPVSTVDVEQKFSAGGNILEARRSFLSQESIQVQVCVDDWTKVEYRQQEMESEVIYDFFDDDHTTGTGTKGSD